MYKAISLALLMWMLVLVACSDPKPEVPADWKTFKSTTHGFSFRYPPTWSINNQSRAQEGLLFYISAPKDNDYDLFLENVNYLHQVVPDSLQDIDKFLAYLQRKTLPNLENIKIVQEEKTQFNGYPAYHSVYQFTVNEMAATIEQIAYMRNHEAYIVTFAAETPRYESYKPTADMIFASIELF